jgi:hypothetical protein
MRIHKNSNLKKCQSEEEMQEFDLTDGTSGLIPEAGACALEVPLLDQHGCSIRKELQSTNPLSLGDI